MKRVAVTGLSGFLGRRFLRDFGGEWDLVALGRQDLERLAEGGASAPYRRTDYSQISLERVLYGCDAVVHLAALRVDDGRGFSDNARISANVFESCLRLGITNVVNASSISVYGPANPLPWSEEQAPEPAGAYGRSKLEAEAAAAACCARGGMRVKSLRLAHLVGPDRGDGYMLSRFLDRARRGEPLEVFGDGAGRREYLYVRDAARALDAALKCPQEQGPFNVGAGAAHSHRELAELVAAAFGSAGGVVTAPAREAGRAAERLDVRRARERLGFSPRWGLERALAQIRES